MSERKQEEDFTNDVEELFKTISDKDDINKSVEKIGVLEKKARNGGDLKSTTRLIVRAIELCISQRDVEKLKEIVVGFSKKHGQMRAAISEMIRCASNVVDESKVQTYTLSGKQREDLIETLRSVTEGKMFLEMERARLTFILSEILLSRNETRQSRDVLGELQVETFGSLDKRQKTEYLLQQAFLNAQINDWLQMKIVTNKINPKIFKEDDTQVGLFINY